MRCVKKGDWKLIEYESGTSGVRETQLFHLKENPHELLREHHDPKIAAISGVSAAKHQVNLAGDPQHAAKLAEMRALLLAQMRELRDPWRFSNQPDDGLMPPESIQPGRGEKVRKKAKRPPAP
jgi:hypothetical protein